MRGISANRLPRSFTTSNCPTAKQCGDCSARHIGICGVLADRDLSALAHVAQRIAVPAGKIFIAEGDPAQFFYDIHQGHARVYKSLRDGRRQITGFMGVGHFLGLAVHGNYAFTAEAMNEVKLCRFERTAIKHVFDAFPALERRLLEVATHELAVAHEQMLLLGRKSARERVAGFLLSWAEKSGGDAHEPVTVALPMSRMDLADYLGLTIETVSRSFSQLKREGLIGFADARVVTLLRRGQLQMVDSGEA